MWVKVDDELYLHPKIVDAGPLAGFVFVASLCYANHKRTDGVIPRRAVSMFANLEGMPQTCWEVADELVRVGLWEADGNAFRIHDYAKYQPTTADADALHEKKVTAGRAGGQASAQARATASASAGGQAESKPVPVPVPEARIPNSDPEGQPERDIPASATPRRPATRRSPSEPDQRVRPVIDHFAKRFAEELGSDYPVVGGRDGAAVKKLPATYSADALCELVDEFWRTDDAWIRNATPSVAVFCSLVPKLVALRAANGARASPSRVAPGDLPDPDQLQALIAAADAEEAALRAGSG